MESSSESSFPANYELIQNESHKRRELTVSIMGETGVAVMP